MSYAIKTKFYILIFLLCTGELLKVTGSPGSAHVGVLNHNVQPSVETALSSKRRSARSARSFYAKWKRTFGIHEATASELEEVGKRSSFCSSTSDVGKKAWKKDCSKLKHCVAKKTIHKSAGCMQNIYCRHPINCVVAGTQGFPCKINGVAHSSCRCVNNGGVGRLEPSGCGNVGGRHLVKCILYECMPNGKEEIVERRCQDAASNCMKVGESGFPCIVSGTRHERCECKAGGVTVPREGCGEHKIGEEYFVDCLLYRCVGPEQQIIVAKGCQDANSKCRKVGETGFPCILNGTRHKSCECKAGGVTVSREGCGEHKIDEEYFVDCQLYRCVGSQQQEFIARACQDENKTCRLVGEHGFACTVGGRQHNNCRCDEDASSANGVIIVPIGKMPLDSK